MALFDCNWWIFPDGFDSSLSSSKIEFECWDDASLFNGVQDDVWRFRDVLYRSVSVSPAQHVAVHLQPTLDGHFGVRPLDDGPAREQRRPSRWLCQRRRLLPEEPAVLLHPPFGRRGVHRPVVAARRARETRRGRQEYDDWTSYPQGLWRVIISLSLSISFSPFCCYYYFLFLIFFNSKQKKITTKLDIFIAISLNVIDYLSIYSS